MAESKPTATSTSGTDGKILLRFSDDYKGDDAHIGQGAYRRSFRRDDEPFEVTHDEARMLLAEDIFVLVDDTQTLPADITRMRESVPTFDPSAPIKTEQEDVVSSDADEEAARRATEEQRRRQEEERKRLMREREGGSGSSA